MSQKDIFEKLKEIFKMVVNNGVDVNSINLNDDIKLDLGVNSIGILYMAVAIEQVFGVDMGKVSTASFKTVGDVVEYIEKETK